LQQLMAAGFIGAARPQPVSGKAGKFILIVAAVPLCRHRIRASADSIQFGVIERANPARQSSVRCTFVLLSTRKTAEDGKETA
jgi:hypothetical protein